MTAEAWRTLRTEWLWVYHGRPMKVNEWSTEIPVPPGVFFVEEGQAKIRAGGREIVVHPGKAFFTAPGVRQQWFKHGTLLLSVGFRSEWPDGTPLFRTGLNCVLKCPALRAATDALFKAAHGRRQTVSYLEAVAPPTLTALQWQRRDAAFHAWFTAYQQELAKHRVLPEPRIGGTQRRVDDILAALDTLPLADFGTSGARTFGVGRRRAEQLVMEHTGLSLKAHLDRRRMTRATESLLTGNTSLKEIAHDLGFRHASHFTLWFRRQTGLTPSAFRNGGGISGA